MTELFGSAASALHSLQDVYELGKPSNRETKMQCWLWDLKTGVRESIMDYALKSSIHEVVYIQQMFFTSKPQILYSGFWTRSIYPSAVVFISTGYLFGSKLKRFYCIFDPCNSFLCWIHLHYFYYCGMTDIIYTVKTGEVTSWKTTLPKSIFLSCSQWNLPMKPMKPPNEI